MSKVKFQFCNVIAIHKMISKIPGQYNFKGGIIFISNLRNVKIKMRFLLKVVV